MYGFGEKDWGSKIYQANSQSITMNNDRSHEQINDIKTQDTPHVQEKRQIDRILHGVVKQRLFGNFLADQTRLSVQNFYKIDQLARITRNKNTIQVTSRQYRTDRHKNRTSTPRKSALHTLDLTSNRTISQYRTIEVRQKVIGLPRLKQERIQRIRGQLMKGSRVQLEERSLGEFFRKWAGGGVGLIHDLRVSKEAFVARHKSADGKLIERFIHFFGFSGSIGFKQFVGLLENAVTCSLQFVFFWVFGVLDEGGTGLVSAGDLFRFLQRFPQNNYLEEETYRLERAVQEHSRQIQIKQEIHVQEMMVVNHALRMEQLKDLLKQSAKERIQASCVKSTCYHQTVLSLDHDPLQRLKQNQIQHTEQASMKLKNQVQDNKKRPQKGLRLRDFYSIFGVKRPRIFCYALSLLTGENPSHFE